MSVFMNISYKLLVVINHVEQNDALANADALKLLYFAKYWLKGVDFDMNTHKISHV